MDRSLDEFVGGDGEREPTADTDDGDEAATNVSGAERGEDTVDADPGAEDSEDADVGTDPSLTVRPAESTMDWTPGGAACASCDRSVERRWRDDGRLVCDDCKEW